jgi:hypothetical protein
VPIPNRYIQALARAHRELNDPATGAIWIRRGEPEAWLVEIIPSMSDDERADEPTYFNPGITFRFPLALIAGNLASLKRAVKRNHALAQDIADGEVLYGDVAETLSKYASGVAARPLRRKPPSRGRQRRAASS